MASLIFNKFMSLIGATGGGTNTSVHWTDSGVSFKVALITGGYTPNAVTHDYWGTVAQYEFPSGALNANNYVSGGAAITARTITKDGSNAFSDYKAGNNTFTALSGNIVVAGLVVYHDTTNSGTSQLCAYLTGSDFPKTANGGDFTIAWNGGVVFRITGG